MVPAIFELRQLKIAKKFRGKVVNTENLGTDTGKDADKIEEEE